MARRRRPDPRPAQRQAERAPGPASEARHERAHRPLAQPRRDTGSWIYGRHAVRAALQNPARRLRRLLTTAENASEAQAWLAEAQAGSADRLRLETVERASLEALLPEGAVHQGVALQAEPLPPAFLEDVLAELPPAPGGRGEAFGSPGGQGDPRVEEPGGFGSPGADAAIVVVLDQVSDPHNVGAVLRSAAAFGARALVLPEHGSPPSTGALAKAASGALEQVPLVRVTNLARALDKLKEAGFWCIGLDESGERPFAELDLGGRVALVLGAEGEGLRRLTRERCDFLARLPTRDPLASLNVSNAAAIALYEVARRRAS